ncbi:hypothetical protein [Campylobacter helveticus]|uniref:hypothetical protein n=1 Tax=Campylobacter helveticus TaxID=28898 RepID=UPI0009C2921C|nr:hypothetical protein [Campylobacter helveticus]ARE81450.1 hypothetical protein CHELV3228_a0077 [Campylobacter helveticus]TXK58165.1 hypothetical protein A9726_00385 [Campylobacter helveticus]SMC24062.1 hypothetical protein SAMN02745125_01802 [Campylobacter helveticus]SUW87683.1 Uncharacterised protein [Campylobacter helveticus]
MKEKTKSILQENIELLNSIHNIVEFFKKHKNLTSYESNFSVEKDEEYEYFHLSFTRSKKYNDCLNFTIYNHSHRKLVFEEVEYKEILKTLILILINIYKLKEFEKAYNTPLNDTTQDNITTQSTTQDKTTLNNHKANSQEKKSFYVEK